jgi:hypothetical protein
LDEKQRSTPKAYPLIASQLTTDGVTHSRTLDESEESPGTLGSPAPFWYFLGGQKVHYHFQNYKKSFIFLDTQIRTIARRK